MARRGTDPALVKRLRDELNDLNEEDEENRKITTAQRKKRTKDIATMKQSELKQEHAKVLKEQNLPSEDSDENQGHQLVDCLPEPVGNAPASNTAKRVEIVQMSFWGPFSDKEKSDWLELVRNRN